MAVRRLARSIQRVSRGRDPMDYRELLARAGAMVSTRSIPGTGSTEVTPRSGGLSNSKAHSILSLATESRGVTQKMHRPASGMRV